VDIISTIFNTIGDLIGWLVHAIFGGTPGQDIDCSDWTNPADFSPGGVWPDGTEIAEDITCGAQSLAPTSPTGE
jgi:hypothetical protein